MPARWCSVWSERLFPSSSGVTILIAFTPLREYIPGYPSGKLRQKLIQNALVTDSLEQKINLYDRYFHDLRAMLSGENSLDTVAKRDSIVRPNLSELKRINQDSLFKDELEQEQFNLPSEPRNPQKKRAGKFALFPAFERNGNQQTGYCCRPLWCGYRRQTKLEGLLCPGRNRHII